MQGEGSQNGNPKIEWDTCLEEVADQCRVNVGDGVRIRDQPWRNRIIYNFIRGDWKRGTRLQGWKTRE